MNDKLKKFLVEAVRRGASDLHITPDVRPIIRYHGNLVELPFDPVPASETHDLLVPTCPEDMRHRLQDDRNLDFAFEVMDEERNSRYRYRANYFFAGDDLGACFRIIPTMIPDFTWANFPLELAERLTNFRNGIILFSGVAGSGKTTSLAMLIKEFMDQGGKRIVTIEEPIEYLFESGTSGGGTSVITQREVGRDVKSFADGLKYGLRQDPDIILVGEIRDQDTAQIALSAAETGHLVLATLHTRDAKGAISRFSDLFEPNMQNEIRAQLALGLRAVVCQHLLPSSIEGSKRELALEILINNSPIASGIRMGKLESLDNNIQTGGQQGMVSLDESIKRLMRDGMITEETATRFVSDAAFLYR